MPTEIIPNLWLGNRKDIKNTDFLKFNKIKCIINATRDLEFNELYICTDRMRLPVDDCVGSDILKNNNDLYEQLNEVVEHIHHVLSRNKSVFVYCYAGKQRSASVICAYIMKYGKVDIDKAIKYIKSKRSKSFTPKVNFYIALKKYENKIE